MKTLFNKFMMAMVAVVMIVGFSAFKMVEKSKSSQTEYFWFEISGDYDPNDVIDVNDALFINHGLEPDDQSMCEGSEYLCIGGFDETQVEEINPNQYILKVNQSALETSRLKN